MSFDARSLERLQQLSRTLPQPLPKPAAAAAPPPATAKRHRVETETDPQALRARLQKVHTGAQRSAHLVGQLLALARTEGAIERAPLEQQLVDGLSALGSDGGAPLTDADAADLVRLFDVQVASRHSDLAARWLRSKGKG